MRTYKRTVVITEAQIESKTQEQEIKLHQSTIQQLEQELVKQNEQSRLKLSKLTEDSKAAIVEVEKRLR